LQLEWCSTLDLKLLCEICIWEISSTSTFCSVVKDNQGEKVVRFSGVSGVLIIMLLLNWWGESTRMKKRRKLGQPC
jgi:hypothetical protein